jgi:hypothetical protein
MPEKPECAPSLTDIEAVLANVVEPLLRQSAAEVGHSLRANVQVFRDGRILDELSESCASSTTEGNLQTGIVRIRFRETGSPSRKLFFAQAVFQPDERTPTFSGFLCRGDVKTTAGETCASFNSWVITREDRAWHPWS